MADKGAGRWSWRGWLPDISAAVSRFPLAVGIAALCTLYKLYLGSDVGDLEYRVLGVLGASFLWVVAVDFFVESQRRSLPNRVLLWLGGILAITLLFWLQWEIWLSSLLLLGGLLLLVGLSGHLGRDERNASFWLFNHRLWLGALLALVGACMFGAGLSIIHGTLNLLFGLELSQHWYEDIWTLSLVLIAPVSFLAFAPRSFTDPITERETSDFTMRAVAALVKFVLVPLLLAYTGILYAYAIKIALEWTLPKGTLGSMVVGYLLTGAATLLLGYPIRETGGTLVRLFWRSWVWLAAMPVVLLFLSVYRRISDYGVTEERYLMVLIGVWALVLAALRVTRGGYFDLRLVPGVLALLLLAASFGPGGAIGFSVMSQRAELADILTAKGVLAVGKLVTRAGSGDQGSPLGTAAARVRGIEWYLNQHHALGLLAPWFAGAEPDPFAPGKAPEARERELFAALGLRPELADSPSMTYFTHYSDQPAVVGLIGPGHVIGPVVVQSFGPAPGPVPAQFVTVEGLGTVTLELDENLLTARLENGDFARFDILDAAKEVYRRGWPMAQDHTPLLLKASGNGLVGTLLIDNLNGAYKEPDFDLSLMRFWLVLAKGQ
jgi:hypothetical protein